MNNSTNPTKGSTPPPSSNKPILPSPAATTTKGSTPPPATTSKATSDIKSTATVRKTSISDLEKELQEFDIDIDKDDVSDAENGQSAKASKKFADEDEVKTLK
jgi:hypothetical protein